MGSESLLWPPSRGKGGVTIYVYDDESRLETMSTDLSGSSNDIYEAFSYTVSGQLKSKDVDVSNSAYRFNPGSNSTKNYAVNDLNQLTSVSGASVSYDARGNLRTRSGYTYSYLDNNLLKSVVKSGVTTTLVYDAEKRLFSIAKSGTTTRFVHDGSRMIAETNASGTVQNRYVHGIGTDDPLVWYVGSGTSSRRYYTKDHQGSIVGGSYNSGGSAFINAYDEYGVNASGNQGRFRYTGQIWLHEIGLYYYKARMYDPDIGRFMQTDPIGYEDGLNWYAYVGNDPINYADPTGKYGRGDGWSDNQWRKFDKIQKRAASRMEKRASKLEKKADRLDAKGKSGGDALRAKAGHFRAGASALRSNGSDGKIANAVSSEVYQSMGGSASGAAFVRGDGPVMTVNIENKDAWGRGGIPGHSVGHEALHTAGLNDQRRSNGARAYKYGNDQEREAFRELKGTPAGDKNPDHLIDEIY